MCKSRSISSYCESESQKLNLMENHRSTGHYNTQIITFTENYNKIKSTWLRAKAVMMSCSLWMIFIGSFIFMLFSESACVLVSYCDNSKLNIKIYLLIVYIIHLLLISYFNFFLKTYHYNSNYYLVIDILSFIAISLLLFHNTKPASDWLSYLLLIGWPFF